MTINSLDVIHGLKTAAAALLAYVITLFLKLDFGYWAVISTVIVMQVYVADSIEICLYRLSGTVIGAVMGVAVILVIPITEVWIGIALFFTIGLCSFLTRYKSKYRMAAITVVIVMTGAQSSEIVRFGLDRVIEISLGIVCAFVVSILIFPRKKADVLRERLETQAAECAEKCSLLVDAFISRQKNVDPTLVDGLLSEVWSNHSFFMNVRRHEALIYNLNDNFAVKLIVIGQAAEHLRNMIRILNSLEGEGYDIIMASEMTALAHAAGRALVSLIRYDSAFESEEVESQLQEMESRLLAIRKEGLIRRFDLKRLVQVISFYSSLEYFAEDISAGAGRLGRGRASGRLKKAAAAS